MKKIPRTARFEDPIYGFRYVVVWNATRDYAAAVVGLDEDEDETCDGAAFFNHKSMEGLIWLREPHLTAHSLSVVTHECLHITVSALEYAGVAPATEDDDEAHAYYLGFLVRSVLEQIFPEVQH